MKLTIFKNFCAELESLWKTLESASQHHIFQSYQWVYSWYETIGAHAQDVKPWIVVVMDSKGCPAILFPFGVRRSIGAGILEFLGGAQADYQGPLIREDWLTNISDIRIAWGLVQESLPKHDARHFVKLPEQWCSADNPMLSIWVKQFQENSYSSQLPSSFDEFKSRLRPKLKSDNSRQRKRLSKIGALKFEVFVESAQWQDALEVLIQQKRRRYREMGVPDIFDNLATCQFYHKIPVDLSCETRIHFSALVLNDEILATHWGGIHRGRFYYLMPTYDAHRWGGFSPGRLLLENLVEWSIQNGLEIFDFTIGGEEYKKDWCDSEMRLFEHLMVANLRGLAYYAYVHLRRRMRRNKRVWGIVKSLYSRIHYGKWHGSKF